MSGPLSDLIPPPPNTLARRQQRAGARLAAVWQATEQPSRDREFSCLEDTQPAMLPAGLTSTEKQRRPNDPQSERPAHHAELLPSLWPFSELPQAVLSAMLKQMRLRTFAPGDAIIRQAERSRHLSVVVDGVVEVCVQDGPNSHDIARLKRGAILGEMGLLTGAPCTASVVAITPVSLVAISARRFGRLALRFPILSCSLGHLVATRLGQGPVDTLVGKDLMGYRVRRCVGRGGMGMVYEAECLESGRRAALKMMSHRFAFDLEAQQRFDREIRICRSLRHPNIGRVLDHFTSFGTSIMVMEFCAGVTLDELLRTGGPLSERRVRSIVGPLAGGLAYVHRRGVCHRDVKPSNIIIPAGRGAVKLVDFGLAKRAAGGELTQRGCVLGTPRYMPPEQLSGQPVDHRADLFALGCVVYEMLVGKPLFAEENVAAILARQLRWSLPPADGIRRGLSADLYALLKQTLAMEPAARVANLEKIGRTWG